MVYMCGRYTSTAAFDELASRFGITIESGTNEDLGARYNAAHSQTVPIITASAKGRRLVMAKWGFRPAWVTPASLAPINARAETAATTRLFATAIREGRCLVPATGFYDWKRVPARSASSRITSGSKVGTVCVHLRGQPSRPAAPTEPDPRSGRIGARWEGVYPRVTREDPRARRAMTENGWYVVYAPFGIKHPESSVRA